MTLRASGSLMGILTARLGLIGPEYLDLVQTAAAADEGQDVHLELIELDGGSEIHMRPIGIGFHGDVHVTHDRPCLEELDLDAVRCPIEIGGVSVFRIMRPETRSTFASLTSTLPRFPFGNNQ